MKIIICLGIYLIVLITLATESLCQSKDCDQLSKREPGEQMTVDLTKHGRLKITSRKIIYRSGEMMVLDAALLNDKEVSACFPDLTGSRIDLKVEKTVNGKLTPYIVVSSLLLKEGLVYLEPGQMITRSFFVLIKCDKKSVKQMLEEISSKDDKTLFENGNFVNWGSHCLDIKRPGKFTFTLAVTNDKSVTANGNINIKTAVGRLFSNSLIITVKN
jgi:hypothetical protein